jgi:hypothetical protein
VYPCKQATFPRRILLALNSTTVQSTERILCRKALSLISMWPLTWVSLDTGHSKFSGLFWSQVVYFTQDQELRICRTFIATLKNIIGWQPISKLSLSDAEITIVLLWGISMQFQTPVDDPVFATHKEFSYVDDNGWESRTCISDYPALSIACTDQH